MFESWHFHPDAAHGKKESGMSAIYDVSLEVFPGMVVWPGDQAVERKRVSKIEAGRNANVSVMKCGVHTGTHVDAPYHFLADGKTMEMLDIQVLVGPAYVADLPGVTTINGSALESAGIPAGTERLLVHTRNSEEWRADPKKFREEYVGLDTTGAEWLVQRGIRLFGIDYLSVATRTQTKPVHQKLLGQEMVLVEGLNLNGVPNGPCKLYCLPLKLRGSDGAPARVIVEVE
jgi:arylformamidase